MHPEGFHKSEEARERCYGCSHPEMLEFTSEDVAQAEQLLADGWIAVSNKYRHIAKVDLPPFEQAVWFSANTPSWVIDRMRVAYRYLLDDYGPRYHGQTQTLTPGVYRAFKRKRCDTARCAYRT